jgi:hypothetical protein
MNDALLTLFHKTEPVVWELYQALIGKIKDFGPFDVEVKKASLHLTHGAAFVGVHPKKKWLDLTIVLAERVTGECVLKSEQVSKSRYHNEVRLAALQDFDGQVMAWLQESYNLKKGK